MYDEPEPLPFSARHWLERCCSRWSDTKTPNGSMSIEMISQITRTTGGRSSACSAPSRLKGNHRGTSMRISSKAGYDQTRAAVVALLTSRCLVCEVVP